MTASRSLPARPSLEFLRKQAKKIARQQSVSLRDAQLILAREYGFAGWRDLTAEISKRVGNDLEWALAEAHRAIHDNDIVGLKQLLAERPALLTWRGDERYQSMVEMATGAYGDAFGPEREHWFTRGTCAEVLIDAGAIVLPRVSEGVLQSRAVGLLHMFERKGLLPQTVFEGDLADDALEVLFYGWLIEEDGGGVRQAVVRLEQEFRASFEEKAASLTAVNFPAVAIPFMAFYKALLPLESSLREAATSGRDDDVHHAFDLAFRFQSEGPAGLSVTRELTLRRSKHRAEYLTTFRWNYRKTPVVVG